MCVCVRVFGRTRQSKVATSAWRRDPRERKEKQKYDGEVTDWFGCTEAHTGARASPLFSSFLFFPQSEGAPNDDVDDLVPDGAAS